VRLASGIPCALCLERADVDWQNSRETRGEIADLYSDGYARSEATKQSTLTCLPHGLLRYARNDGSGCLIIESPMSSPAKAGDPVFQRRQRWNRKAAAYWIPAFAGMTSCGGAARSLLTSPRLRGEVARQSRAGEGAHRESGAY
jgi:hypothetical protein